jgi:hypothetical protein
MTPVEGESARATPDVNTTTSIARTAITPAKLQRVRPADGHQPRDAMPSLPLHVTDRPSTRNIATLHFVRATTRVASRSPGSLRLLLNTGPPKTTRARANLTSTPPKVNLPREQPHWTRPCGLRHRSAFALTAGIRPTIRNPSRPTTATRCDPTLSQSAAPPPQPAVGLGAIASGEQQLASSMPHCRLRVLGAAASLAACCCSISRGATAPR